MRFMIHPHPNSPYTNTILQNFNMILSYNSYVRGEKLTIEHFSHPEHPLRTFVVDEDEYPKPHRCAICGLPILSSHSYTCAADCNFFLHKPCADERLIPKEMFHHNHQDTLVLERVGDSTSFAYRCRNYSECRFGVHPLMAKPVEIRSKHMSHEAHPLVAFCREIVSVCDGCGEEEKGFFFYCQECNFWIHDKCTVLPMAVKLPLHHPHPYILTYSMSGVPAAHPPDPPVSYTRDAYKPADCCSICGNTWLLPKSGLYHCAECNASLAHVACVNSTASMEILNPEREFILVPDEEESFPSLSIRRFVERNTDQEKTKMEHHGHPLIQLEALIDSVCDVCTQPLHSSSPHYKCHLPNCPFTTHEICANHLPMRFKIDTKFRQLQLDIPHYMYSFSNPIFTCHFCGRMCNGYPCHDMGLPFDLECAVTPKTLKHSSHKQHLLRRSGIDYYAGCTRCCSLPALRLQETYNCVICDYVIHLRCALLPQKTRHKYDQHPLHLITTAHDHRHMVQFCEFCEEEIELKFWYYGCHECGHYFHINCIPSVGHISKINFGKTYIDHRFHQHPLTLAPMLTHGFNERCQLCSQIIQGFQDQEMAFHCDPCQFWIHFSCALDKYT